MRKIIIALIIIAVFIAGYFIVNNLIKNKPIKEDNSFKWGVGINPYPNGVHTKEELDRVLKDAKELKVRWLRFGWPSFIAPDDFSYMDKIIPVVKKQGFNIVLGYDPQNKYQEFDNPYQTAYNETRNIATHYKNEIRYFQVGNEPAGSCVKGSWPGLDEQSYDLDKCKKVIAWLKGASDGIKSVNPNAKILITGHWLHTGFFDMLVANEVNFDIIGWDCNGFSTTDITKIENGGKEYNLAEMLKSFNKELWITEINTEKGSLNSQKEQADFIAEFIKNIYNTKAFSGLFIFILHDEMHVQGTEDANLGLVKINKVGNTFTIGGKKEAFFTYQDIIENLK